MKNKPSFHTVKTEGLLLPTELLDRVAALDVKLPGTRPEDYHLAPGERVNETINRSWNRLLGVWRGFRSYLADTEDDLIVQAKKADSVDVSLTPIPYSPFATRYSLFAATAPTRDRWLLPLFQELGYGRLQREKAVEIEGRAYPVSHRWENTPIHLVGAGLDLDKRAPGQAGAAQASPHGLVQAFLNRSEGHLWAFVSNGLKLRILRDNQILTRQAFVEFDLAAMMDGELYADFRLLWLLCHQSRVESERPEQCWLEKWTQEAQQQGVRALDELQRGVTEAIAELGSGFLAHPANAGLQARLSSGALSAQDYYRQLLRLVYRLIFLFVAEDRDVLLLPDAADQAKQRYRDYYSTARLRRLSGRLKGSRHADLYESLKLVMGKLHEQGCPPLALPALGSFLWSPAALPDLAAAKLDNRAFLAALRALAYTRKNYRLRPVDYRNLGSEELGSVYESLLELHPELHRETATFRLKTAAGNERKTTGSYYTPDSLVQCLLDSALEPVVKQRRDEAMRMANSEWRIVNGEWRMVDSGWQMEKQDARLPFATHHSPFAFYEQVFQEYANQRLSRTGSVAKGYDHRQASISIDKVISQRGTVWYDLADSAGGSVDSGQYRGRMGETLPGGVHPVSKEGQRQPNGIGNTFDSERRCRPMPEGIHSSLDGGTHDSGQANACFGAQSSEEANGEWRIANGEGGADHQPFATHHSPLASERLWNQTPFAIRYSLFATAALLRLKICDPAVGSGHFLIAAAHRLAKHVAAVRTDEEEPGPAATRTALREVIGHCLYGVDINPMSAELCKISLWLEAMEPGKPLAFLDHHIKCGNSLLGATPEAIEAGIPDEAYKPITGDSKDAANWMKKLNQDAKKGQGNLFDLFEAEPWDRLGNLPAALAKLEGLDDDTPEALAAKEKLYREIVEGAGYDNARLLHDAWCAAFVWPKDKIEPGTELTTRQLRDIEASPHKVSPWLKAKIKELAGQYGFFHWHLEFPGVFGMGANSEQRMANGMEVPPPNHSPFATHHSPHSGFDCVLGNPPWERVKLQEKEFFAERSPEIANAPNAAARKRMIARLSTDNPALMTAFQAAQRQAEGENCLLRDSGLYPLCGRGDINLYAVFAELGRQRLAASGAMGLVLPSGIATDDTTKFYFQEVVKTGTLVSLFDFENKGIFPGVHSSYKFCLFVARGGNRGDGIGTGRLGAGRAGVRNPPLPTPSSLLPNSPPAEFVFFAHSMDDLNDPERRFTLSAEDIALLNPNTCTCPIFRTRRDAELTKAIYRRVPVLVGEGSREKGVAKSREAFENLPPSAILHSLDPNPWDISFSTMFHMSNDSHLFRTREQLEADEYILQWSLFEKAGERYLPLYEAKMLHHYDHRWATYSGANGEWRMANGTNEFECRDATLDEKQHFDFIALPRYWVPEAEVEKVLAGKWQRQWLLGFRNICRSTDERTVITGIVPRAGVGNNLPLMLLNVSEAALACCLSACLTSMVCDFVARFKVGGTHLNFFIAQQLPVLPPATYAQPCPWQKSKDGDPANNPGEADESPYSLFATPYSLQDWLLPRVLELTYTAWDLEPFAQDCGFNGPPFRWDEARRFLLRCELDAAFFHLYLGANSEGRMANGEERTARGEDASPLFATRYSPFAHNPRDDVDYIMETFPIVKRKDEAKHGEYRTKRVILEIYDALQQAMDTGEPYQTLLDPPPADPRCCHPPR